MSELVLARARRSPSCPPAAPPPRPPPRSRSSARASGGAGSAGRPRRCRTAAPGSGSRPRRRPARVQAIQPACRPMTSTIITRLCDSAVVCSLSMASIAIWTAVSKPNVMSVPARSLSIVFGTPITGSSWSPFRRAAAPSVSSPPIAIRPSIPRRRASRGSARAVVALEGWCATSAGSSRRAAGFRASTRVSSSWIALERPAPAVAEAHDLVAVVVDPPAHDRSDDRVQAGAVASPREHADPHARHDTRARQNGAPWNSHGTADGGRPPRSLVCARAVGCLGDGGGDEPSRVEGDTATVYSSAPRHGASAAAASAVVEGERRALDEAGGRAGGLRIRLGSFRRPTTSPSIPGIRRS